MESKLIFRIKSTKFGFKFITQKSSFNCLAGRFGVINYCVKEEGDGKTPKGTFLLKKVFYRHDRITSVETVLPKEVISESLGWCDDPTSDFYNQLIKLPFAESHEKLWRKDNKYNVLVELGYNDNPVVTGKGSAIFIHCTEQEQKFTNGCIALKAKHLLIALNEAQEKTYLSIE